MTPFGPRQPVSGRCSSRLVVSRRVGGGLVGLGLTVVLLAGCAAIGSRPGASPSAAIPTPTAVASGPAAGVAAGGSGAQRVPVPAMGAAVRVPKAERPVRISVPSIGVNSSLVDLGIAGDGSLQVPTDVQRAGWLDRSPAPGRQGPAVIAGHVDSTKGPAVFYRLRDLKPGARIIVTRGDGSTVSFAVDSVQQYSKSAFPTAAVYGPVPGPVLRLITCGGAFDRSIGHYRDNVVVYAS